MFYRPGGTDKAPNRQQDYVYADFIGGQTDWLPVNKGDTIAINIARASIVYNTPAQSQVTTSAIMPEVQILMEMCMQGGPAAITFPVDQWQNMVVATSRRAQRAGFIRLRIVNINNADGTGVMMALQVTRTGDDGAVH
jgi:hypothetical protein